MTASDGNAPDLDEHQISVFEHSTVAEPLIGETRVAVGPLKARIAELFTILHAAKECLEGMIQAGEHILQDQ
jgi:hypothetical protein